MIDLNALVNKSKLEQPAPTPTKQERINVLKTEIAKLEDKLKELETNPSTVDKEAEADGVTPEKILSLWRLRLSTAQAELQKYESEQDSKYTSN